MSGRIGKALRCGAALIAALLLFLPLLHADIIHFKDGRKLEGKILKEEKTFVEIKTKFGTVKVERDRIGKDLGALHEINPTSASTASKKA